MGGGPVDAEGKTSSANTEQQEKISAEKINQLVVDLKKAQQTRLQATEELNNQISLQNSENNAGSQDVDIWDPEELAIDQERKEAAEATIVKISKISDHYSESVEKRFNEAFKTTSGWNTREDIEARQAKHALDLLQKTLKTIEIPTIEISTPEPVIGTENPPSLGQAQSTSRESTILDTVSFGESGPEVSKTKKVAKDSVCFNNDPISDPGLASSTSTQAGTSAWEVNDPITEAIRQQIIARQNEEILAAITSQEGLAQDGMGPVKTQATKEDLDAIAQLSTREAKAQYLEENAGLANAAMDNPAMQKKLHDIEVEGYAAIHREFKGSFKDIEWERAGNSRTTPIRNASGDKVCDLTETTITGGEHAPGGVSKYRQINFPKALEENTGPLHLSMALQDSDGNNMAEDEAVYFTAHYDKSGKLTEMSTPQPLKFKGTGDNAIGYIEVDNKIYTLPITQGNYTEMKQELAQNREVEAIRLSPAPDKEINAATKIQAAFKGYKERSAEADGQAMRNLFDEDGDLDPKQAKFTGGEGEPKIDDQEKMSAIEKAKAAAVGAEQSANPNLDKKIIEEKLEQKAEIGQEAAQNAKKITTKKEAKMIACGMIAGMGFKKDAQIISNIANGINTTPEQQAALEKKRGASQKSNSELQMATPPKQATLGSLTASKSPNVKGGSGSGISMD